MRICFLCIGYEPGSDGVGDYVRGLSGCLPANITACVIALNDPLASETSVCEDDVVRISSHLPRRERYRRAAAAMQVFDPDVVSLHFVTWAFGPKGVVLSEASALRTLIGDRCLHIMFHEPWIRPSRRNSRSRFLILSVLGHTQRASIVRMTNILRPAVCHTSNQDYQTLFRDAGIATGLLPVFGSIVPVAGDGWKTVRILAKATGHRDLGERQDYFVAGLFGAIREHWDALPLLRRLLLFSQASTRRLLLISVGHNTPLGKEMLHSWTTTLPEMVVVALGSQPGEMISQVVSGFDVGLAHQPAAALGRSTTTAAMLEHGIPVVVAMGGKLAEDDPFGRRWGTLLIEDGPSLENEIGRARCAPLPAGDLRREVTTQLVTDLERACVSS